MSFKVGIIAGDGDFPLEVIKSIRYQKKDVFVIGVKGSASKKIENYPHSWIRMGQIGSAIKILKKNNCRDLILIGGVRKPNVWLLFPDFGALKLFFRLISLSKKGDASILKELISFLEEDHHFNIIGAEKYISHLLISDGLLSERSLTADNRSDIKLAIKKCHEIGLNDIGQACVVVDGEVILSEDIGGTDEMLKKIICKNNNYKGRGVLVKMTKPFQDRRVDLPAIGIRTLKLINKIGLSGIALESNSAFISEKTKVIEYANSNNLFIYGLSKDKAFE